MAESENVEVLKSFNKTPRGDLAEVGEVIAVDTVRAGELERLGLARRQKASKAAPAPENKMASEPANKAGEASVTVRRTGRKQG